MSPTELTTQLAAQIADHIRAGNAPEGTRLVERTLAETLRVSCSPIRGALRLLAEEGVVGATDRGGFVVAQGSGAIPARSQSPTGDEEAYLAIAGDRLRDALPKKVTENALARRYNLTKGWLRGSCSGVPARAGSSACQVTAGRSCRYSRPCRRTRTATASAS